MTLPTIRAGLPQIAEFDLPSNTDRIDLSIDARRFPGDLHVVAPPQLLKGVKLGRPFRVGGNDDVASWSSHHLTIAERLFKEGKFRKRSSTALVDAVKAVAEQPLISVLATRRPAVITSLRLEPGDRPSMFFRIDEPTGAKPGDTFSFYVLQMGRKSRSVQGGATYRVVVTAPPQ